MGYVGKWGGWDIKWLIIRVFYFCFCSMFFFFYNGVFVQCCLVVYLSVFRWCLFRCRLDSTELCCVCVFILFFFFFYISRVLQNRGTNNTIAVL